LKTPIEEDRRFLFSLGASLSLARRVSWRAAQRPRGRGLKSKFAPKMHRMKARQTKQTFQHKRQKVCSF
jgi:hypothetical protein